jgi:transketolase
MAMASKLNKDGYRVYCLLGDGEIEEGQVWEAAMTAAHYKLDNLCVIVDNNNLQIDGEVGNVMSPYPIDEKFKSFGFEVLTIDGHNFKDILDAFNKARSIKE